MDSRDKDSQLRAINTHIHQAGALYEDEPLGPPKGGVGFDYGTRNFSKGAAEPAGPVLTGAKGGRYRVGKSGGKVYVNKA